MLCFLRTLITINRHLEPGGYIEIVDIAFPIESDDGSLTPDSALAKWSNYMFEASKNLQRPLDSGKTCKGLLASAGFTDVVETQYKWPQNRWPKEPRFKELGEFEIRDPRLTDQC